MVTVLGHEAIVLDAIKAGTREFIIKPFRNQDILKAVMKTVITSKICETRIFT